jgi:hypothetical protein
MSSPRPPYWFPAKRYGWGWGIPSRWQGWVVVITWIAAVVAMSLWLPEWNLPLFFVFIAAMTVILIAICYAKGEPPRWRWGK